MNRTSIPIDRRPVGHTPTLRQRIRTAFPLADGVTYLYAAAVLGTTWVVADLLERLGLFLGITQ